MPTSRPPRPESSCEGRGQKQSGGQGQVRARLRARPRERQLHLLAEQLVIGRSGQADRGVEDAQLGVECRRVGGRRRAERGKQLGHLDRCLVLVGAVLGRDEEFGDRGLHLLLRLVAAEHVDDVVPDVLVQLHEEPVARFARLVVRHHDAGHGDRDGRRPRTSLLRQRDKIDR
jgi:hypothetical protein